MTSGDRDAPKVLSAYALCPCCFPCFNFYARYCVAGMAIGRGGMDSGPFCHQTWLGMEVAICFNGQISSINTGVSSSSHRADFQRVAQYFGLEVSTMFQVNLQYIYISLSLRVYVLQHFIRIMSTLGPKVV